MQILLYDDVASARERGVFLTYQRSVDRRLVRGVFRAIDKAEQIAVIEIAKAVDLVRGGDCVTQLRHDLSRQLEGDVEALGANVEKQIARSGHDMSRAGADFAEGMELGGSRLCEEPVPRVGSKADDAGQLSFQVAEAHGAYQLRQVSAQRTDALQAFDVWVHR